MLSSRRLAVVYRQFQVICGGVEHHGCVRSADLEVGRLHLENCSVLPACGDGTQTGLLTHHRSVSSDERYGARRACWARTGNMCQGQPQYEKMPYYRL